MMLGRFPAALLLSACALCGADLINWVHEGPKHTFAISGNSIETSGAGGHPNWLRTDREFENFRLRFDYKLAEWAEAAVVLRAPRAGRPMRSGIAIMLAHDFHNQVTEHVTGAVVGVLKPRKALPESFEKWHGVDILLDGARLKVTIDGLVTQDIDIEGHPELRYRLKRGYIGFPDMDHAYKVRNVRVENLGGSAGFVEPFDGETLDGWDLRGGGEWAVKDGVIRGSNGHGILYAPGEFQDFELTTLVRSHNRVNGGVFLRGKAQGQPRGFEIQIHSPPDSVYPTGSIYKVARSRISADYEERWFLLQVRVEGARCMVRLDGETVAETDALPVLAPGRIGLQIHKENASVEFRDIRVRPL